jgi:hypothetical protein
MNKLMNEKMYERTNEWMNEWMNEWIRINGGMILTERNPRTRRKTGPSDTLPTTNPTSTGVGSNSAVRGRTANRMSHCTVSRSIPSVVQICSKAIRIVNRCSWKNGVSSDTGNYFCKQGGFMKMCAPPANYDLCHHFFAFSSQKTLQIWRHYTIYVTVCETQEY